jgi:predicted nuclease of predicted toxin-antitoxin system
LKRRSNTSRHKRHNHRFFLDRNLGAYELAKQLRNAGLDITVHDDIYARTERDPWIFYEQGKEGFIVVTTDKLFMKSFPHMAAIALGKTTVLYFSNNNWKSRVRGDAFLATLAAIMRALREPRKPFIASIGMGGTFSIVEEKPRPTRKKCDPSVPSLKSLYNS